MDQCTHDVRTQYWRQIIHNCTQRPSGQSAKNWMKENGVSEQRFYYWQRRFRKEIFNHLQESGTISLVPSESDEVSFVEIPCSITSGKRDMNNSSSSPVAVLRNATMVVEISNDISESVLSQILKAVSNA